MKKNVTYIISDINKALAFEWVATYLDKNKFNLNFIIVNSKTTELETFLIENKFKVLRVDYNRKIDSLFALYKIYRYLRREKIDIVHTHLFIANLVGLTAAYFARIKKRIYTRHYSDFHHVKFPNMVKYDRYINFLSTDIIAISKVVKKILIELEFVSNEKIHLIHHGFDLDKFSDVSLESINLLKIKYNIDHQYPIIGSIARYTEWKGVQYLIPAFKLLLKKYPNALLILATAYGDYENEINKLLEDIPKKNYLEIEFENDLFAFYKLFDVFVHIPINKDAEAFGQIYVEALASCIPSVFTLGGVAVEFIIDKRNALAVPFKNSSEVFSSIVKILNDKELKDQLVFNGKNDVREKFRIEKMIFLLEQLYAE